MITTIYLYFVGKEVLMALTSQKLPILEMFSVKEKLATRTTWTGANLILILFGSLLLAVSAQYKVPLGPVPITLQSLVVMLIATIYGWRLGSATVIAYWIEGIFIGGIFSFIPWFANGSGLGYFIGSPSAGFLWGFLPMVVVIGYLAHNLAWQQNIVKTVLALLAGQVILYSFGLVHALLLVMPIVDWMNTPSEMLTLYLYPFLIGDLLKTMIATLITIYFSKRILRNFVKK